MNCIKSIARSLAKPIFKWLKTVSPKVAEVIIQKRIADILRFAIEFLVDLIYAIIPKPHFA